MEKYNYNWQKSEVMPLKSKDMNDWPESVIRHVVEGDEGGSN
jgi:hypothetical protein